MRRGTSERWGFSAEALGGPSTDRVDGLLLLLGVACLVALLWGAA